MPTTFPPDRFDQLPRDLQRVGAHRAPGAGNRRLVVFGWSALATGLLVAAGVLALAAFTDSINIDLPFESGPAIAPSDTPVETVAPLLDPAVPITVLNGTTTNGLANQVGDFLVAQGWGGAADGIGSRASATDDAIKETTIYYGDPVNEAAARALVVTLGVGSLSLSNTYPTSPITVVVGSDYTPPTG